MNRIRVVAANVEECFRCTRCLDAAGVRFDLNQQQASGTVLIFVEDEFLQVTLDTLSHAGFTIADPISD